ncbi:MAG: hypothetical protein QNJ70_20270 [Xenococcaceae cyanobacterium MO_207.B15]|nr:hypothetical protein [Xenococcaceae cyanobacterium MO_207.B15]
MGEVSAMFAFVPEEFIKEFNFSPKEVPRLVGGMNFGQGLSVCIFDSIEMKKFLCNKDYLSLYDTPVCKV